MGDAGEFRVAGRTLFSLGLIKGAEGNLSEYRDSVLRITRTGSHLDRLEDGDIVAGELGDDLPGASGDLAVHRGFYLEHGPGAVAHAHPAGSVVEGRVGPGQHGLYTFAGSLQEAVDVLVRQARAIGATA